MFSAILGRFHVWESNGKLLCSDERTKHLTEHADANEAVNFLFTEHGDIGKVAARALHAKWKEHLSAS